MPNIKLNGETREVGERQSIAAVLESLNIENKNLAVELNGEFLEADTLESTMLEAGDTLEIVRFVGGG